MIKLINLPIISDIRGNLSVVEEECHIPFKIKRIYWVYDVPGGELRGSRALRGTEEFIIAVSGSFDVIMHDGYVEHKYSLNRSYYGLFLPRMTWRRLENFSTNSLALVLSSKEFDDKEYIRDFNRFLKDKI